MSYRHRILDEFLPVSAVCDTARSSAMMTLEGALSVLHIVRIGNGMPIASLICALSPICGVESDLMDLYTHSGLAALLRFIPLQGIQCIA